MHNRTQAEEDHSSIWSTIRAQECIPHSNARSSAIKEWIRLKAYWLAKKNRPPSNSIHGKRHEKGNGKGVGLVTSHSFIKSQVPIERHFPAFTIGGK